MKILSDADIHSELERLMDKYSSYKWAVAWARPSKDDMHLLLKHEKRIKKLIIGTHFYQTHPHFIDKFKNNDRVRYILPSGGVYHPKVYLFENGNGAWECIIGSPNFTLSAFKDNRETAVLISHTDIDAKDAYSTIDKIISADWNEGKQIDETAFEKYKIAWASKPRSRKEQPDQPSSQDADVQSPLDLETFDILYISWPQYYQKITTEDKNQDVHSLTARKKVLEFAQCQLVKSFNKLDILAQKRIAGLIKDDEADWKYFGSMKGSGFFMHAININNQNISGALDKIPMEGEVYKENYENYIQEFSKAFAQGKGGGIATATRLLAMKRPDYFLCVDGENKDALCKDFDIHKNITVDNYWDRVVEKVKKCAWWQAERPDDPEELTVWKYRVALLDVLYYRP